MTFEEVKKALVDATKPVQICEGLPDVENAEDDEQLIASGREFIEWSYQQGILNDLLLAEIDQVKLMEQGIFTAGVVNLTNPILNDIYTIGPVTLNLTLTGKNKAKIVVLGAAIVNVTASGTSYIRVKKYKSNSHLSINLSGKAAGFIDINGNGSVEAIIAGTSVLHALIYNSSYLYFTGSDQSVANVKCYQDSTIVKTVSGSCQLYLRQFNNASTLNDGSAL